MTMKVSIFAAILWALMCRAWAQNPFEEFQRTAMAVNPVREAGRRIGYGENSIQPYYICDREDSGSSMPLAAWHYSCKQACRDENTRTHIMIKQATWRYIGKEITTYKVVANRVCYTSHENVWGYCTQSQTVTPDTVTEADKKDIPKEYFDPESKILGVTYVTNSEHAECSYMSDNTVCKKDFVITYRAGRLSKKSNLDPQVLNIYGDGIRTDPGRGALYNNNAAWFWNKDDVMDRPECGWTIGRDIKCKITNTSEMMYCPDIGYQYNIHTLKPVITCAGMIYDKDGPMPFRYDTSQQQRDRKDILEKAKEGKGDPEISMIIGINTAFEEIEETYCSSSCDLFARGIMQDDNYVLETPIGNWRIVTQGKAGPMLSPCKPTATWRVKNPTTLCHGKNHLLVEDSETKHTCSWNTENDFIITDDVCNQDQATIDKDVTNLRAAMAKGQEFKLEFWTGDKMILRPPYTDPIWERTNLSIPLSPSWFSKVSLSKDMLHNQVDISSLITSMVQDTKQEIQYNATKGKTIRTLLADEILGGAEEIGRTVWSVIVAILGTVPKFLLLIVVVIFSLYITQKVLSSYVRRKISPQPEKKVTFEEVQYSQHTPEDTPPAARPKRGRSRSSRLAHELSFI